MGLTRKTKNAGNTVHELAQKKNNVVDVYPSTINKQKKKNAGTDTQKFKRCWYKKRGGRKSHEKGGVTHLSNLERRF